MREKSYISQYHNMQETKWIFKHKGEFEGVDADTWMQSIDLIASKRSVIGTGMEIKCKHIQAFIATSVDLITWFLES